MYWIFKILVDHSEMLRDNFKKKLAVEPRGSGGSKRRRDCRVEQAEGDICGVGEKGGPPEKGVHQTTYAYLNSYLKR